MSSSAPSEMSMRADINIQKPSAASTIQRGLNPLLSHEALALHISAPPQPPDGLGAVVALDGSGLVEHGRGSGESAS